MTPSEATELLEKWNVDYEMGFAYTNYGTFETHYVVIRKDDDNKYSIIAARSTCKDGPFNKEQMEKLLGANKLTPHGNNGGWQIDFKGYRSKGCQCGAWATQNPDCHAYYCPMWRKD